jgi:hypothetical protein
MRIDKERFQRAAGAFGTAAGLLVLLAMIPQAAYSLFGFDIVADLETEAELGTLIGTQADQLSTAINLFNQTVKLYEEATQTYNQLHSAAQFFHGGLKMNWMTVVQTAVNNETESRGLETVNWSAVLNGHPSFVGPAWTGLTTPVQTGVDFAKIAATPSLMHRLGPVEARDGFGQQCLETLSQYRQNGDTNTPIIQKFFQTVTGEGDDSNSEVEQLNELNVGGVQASNEARAQGQLHACEVQARVLDQVEKREQEARQLNYEAGLESGRQAQIGKLGHMSDTLNHYLPH